MRRKYVVEVDIDSFKKMNYEELIRFNPDLNIDEKEGLTNLKDNLKDFIDCNAVELFIKMVLLK